MTLAIIVATDENGLIGLNGTIPWDCPDDLRRFYNLTKYRTVIMGRATWESLPLKPLPYRTNIVLSSNPKHYAVAAYNAQTLKQALSFNNSNLQFIIGGEQVFKEALPNVEFIYKTLIRQSTPVEEGDQTARYFILPEDEFTLMSIQDGDGYQFQTWKRKAEPSI